ncbi:retropepsin-like aspartic protease family protein [Poseidonocella sedimentorum]|uniref:Aspartyl protease family protein n=1 Tax=Poseidonocella sedimentorum TaxID=871652 RepID=A0A1I6DZN3_9RHOB|nr:TIGR02281 family clan AA aspartic protease [Poseidonocella sedimentorum]SFR10791.1 aspartyl protease family protein [Poseidonocella sedimentorum]
MSPDQTANFIYLSLLLIVIGGSYLVASRRNLGRLLQQAVVWGLIFMGGLAVFGLWDDIRGAVVPVQRTIASNVIEVPRAADSHFYLTLEVDGTPIRFVVDTGATEIVLSQRDAERAGIDTETLAYLGRASTANGMVRTARVTLDELTLGPVTDRRVPVWVNEGAMEGSLLGMSYLNRFASVELTQGKLVLTR